jgi:hypothetical protein
VDWKRFYADELSSDAGRAAIAAAPARRRAGNDVVVTALREGGIVSFPHTTLTDSAGPLARVAASVLATGARRIVALGVLHGGALPEPWRADVAELARGSPRADELLRRVGGAFVAAGPARTPFGDVAAGPAPATRPFVRADDGILANEFSLDLFLAVLAAVYGEHGATPPAVTRVFVSVTRDAKGSFAAAGEVARSVAPLLLDGAVCVATGDLVHYGNSYTPPEAMRGMPEDAVALARHFEDRVARMLAAGLEDGDLARAFEMGTSELRSDQRHLLPVIAALLGAGARAEILSFRMSDYAAINGVARPCLVASALVAFRRATAG